MEDVAFMRKVGVEQAYLLLVDSSQRDKRYDKHPNQYDVVFTTPFRNVVGIDIVAASVPRTQYVVEENSNMLAYKLQNDTTWTCVRLPTGDYAITTLITAMNAKFAAIGSPLNIQAVSSPATVKNKIQLYAPVPFSVNMTLSTMRRSLGFNEPPTAPIAATGVYDMPANYVDTDPDVFVSNLALSTGTGQTPCFSGPQASEGNSTVPLSSTNFVRQRFTATAGGQVSAVALYADIRGVLPANDGKINFVIIDESNKLYASGTIPVPNPVQAGLPAYFSDAINTSATIESNNVYYVILYDADVPEDGTNSYVLYSTQLLTANNVNNVSVGTGTSYSTVTWSDYENANDDMCLGVQVTPSQYQVTSPGLYDLTGERYVNVRCSQIEDHMFGARAYESHNVGMAKIDLGVFGYSDSRFDFASLPPRKFHPIAKLNRLTFRFERPDGTLYNFYGVDHTMVLSVRYLVTDESKTGLEKLRILNPHYDPDLQNYMASRTLNYHDQEDED
jgi:hypothetical protein